MLTKDISETERENNLIISLLDKKLEPLDYHQFTFYIGILRNMLAQAIKMHSLEVT